MNLMTVHERKGVKVYDIDAPSDTLNSMRMVRRERVIEA